MKYVPNALSRTVVRTVLKAKADSPSLMFYGGVVGVVGAAVLACRATLQLDDKLNEMAKERLESEAIIVTDRNGNDIEKVKTLVYLKNVSTVAKLYAPAIGLGAVSIAALAGSHRTLTKRNIALTAAYAAVERGFADYRARVLADVGEEKEREYRYPLVDVEIEDAETGKKIKTKLVSPDAATIYARFFDESNANWGPSSESNMMFLRTNQIYLNDRLHANGHIFLNEVYDQLGIPRSKAGAVVGWVISKDGDNYIDFGIFDADNDRKRAFVNGHEYSILLDFNVDGVIYDKI